MLDAMIKTTDKVVSMRKYWTLDEVNALMARPFMDLLFEAQRVHRAHHRSNYVQVSTILSIKTGGCPEDCKYCPQSARHHTDLKTERLLEIEKVLSAAQSAKDAGSMRFCMGAAWKNPKARDMPYLVEMIKQVKAMGLETCMSLGMLSADQAKELHQAGLDYYNHNLDTSPEFYGQIITTRTFQDRLNTLAHVRDSGMKVCAGGIIGLGESAIDRAQLLIELANLPEPPESIPINRLIKIKGTPLEDNDDVEPFEFIKLIAVARLMMPKAMVRLSAGRESMNEQMQALCFMAGANSIFYGCKLLTAANPSEDKDMQLFDKLGINREFVSQQADNEREKVILDKTHHQAASRPCADDLFYDASLIKNH